MKLLLLLIALTLLAPLRTLAGEPGEPPQIQVRSVQADFIQEKHLKILARPIISTGTFTFQAPQSLRWEYRSPIASILLMHGGTVRKFVERDGVLLEEKGMGLDSMQVVLAEISNWLGGRVADNDLFRVTFPDKRTILLTPKEPGLAALISSIELKLADQPGLLDEVTIFEGADSTTRLTFSNRILNQEIPPSLFIDR